MLFKRELPEHFAVHHGLGLVYGFFKGLARKEVFVGCFQARESEEILPYEKP